MSKSRDKQFETTVAGEIGILARRRIEAAIIAPIYKEIAMRYGDEAAKSIIDTAIRTAALEAGKSFAQKTPRGTDLRSFQDLQVLWTQDDALSIEIEKASDEEFHYKVTRCRYAEMYQEMGLGDIGHLLSCNRDYVFPEGYNTDIKLQRTQTIMEGSSCCDFRYSYKSQDQDSGVSG